MDDGDDDVLLLYDLILPGKCQLRRHDVMDGGGDDVWLLYNLTLPGKCHGVNSMTS